MGGQQQQRAQSDRAPPIALRPSRRSATVGRHVKTIPQQRAAGTAYGLPRAGEQQRGSSGFSNTVTVTTPPGRRRQPSWPLLSSTSIRLNWLDTQHNETQFGIGAPFASGNLRPDRRRRSHVTTYTEQRGAVANRLRLQGCWRLNGTVGPRLRTPPARRQTRWAGGAVRPQSYRPVGHSVRLKGTTTATTRRRSNPARSRTPLRLDRAGAPTPRTYTANQRQGRAAYDYWCGRSTAPGVTASPTGPACDVPGARPRRPA